MLGKNRYKCCTCKCSVSDCGILLYISGNKKIGLWRNNMHIQRSICQNVTSFVLCLLPLFILCTKFHKHFPVCHNMFNPVSQSQKSTISAFWYNVKMWIMCIIALMIFRIFFKLIYYACLMIIKLIILLCLAGVHVHVCGCVCLHAFPNSEPTVRDAFQPRNHHLLAKLRARQSCTFRREGRLVLLRNPQLHFQQWDEPGL